jgi:hypothetical protein
LRAQQIGDAVILDRRVRAQRCAHADLDRLPLRSHCGRDDRGDPRGHQLDSVLIPRRVDAEHDAVCAESLAVAGDKSTLLLAPQVCWHRAAEEIGDVPQTGRVAHHGPVEEAGRRAVDEHVAEVSVNEPRPPSIARTDAPGAGAPSTSSSHAPVMSAISTGTDAGTRRTLPNTHPDRARFVEAEHVAAALTVGTCGDTAVN